jgi:hypothetical protein
MTEALTQTNFRNFVNMWFVTHTRPSFHLHSSNMLTRAPNATDQWMRAQTASSQTTPSFTAAALFRRIVVLPHNTNTLPGLASFGIRVEVPLGEVQTRSPIFADCR